MWILLTGEILLLFFFLMMFMFITLVSILFQKNFDVIFLPLSYIYILVIMGGNISNPDTEIYTNMYYNNIFTKDMGFAKLINFGHMMNLNYNEFKLLVSFIGLSLIYLSLFGIVKNKMIFVLLYFIYPFFFDIVQLRNFLCMSFFILGFRCLISENKFFNLLYIPLILLGASMQKVGLVYLPIFFLRDLYEKKWIKSAVAILIFISILIGLSGSALNSFVDVIMSSLQEDLVGLENYLDRNTNMGWVIFWLEQFFAFFIVFLGKKLIDGKLYNITVKEVKFINYLYSTQYYMFFFLPLFVLDESFTRIIRNVLPLNSMLISIMIISIIKKYKNTKYFNFYEILFIFISIAYQITLFFLMKRSYNDNIIIPAMRENWIWK